MATFERIMELVEKAYKIGYEEKRKTQMTKPELFEHFILLGIRRFHKKVIWEAYRSGKFSKLHGDV
jgi:hypothetical protein